MFVMSTKFWHVFNVFLYVLGIVGGVSGGATFYFMYSNNAASLWAGVSVLLLFLGLIQELLKHNDLLHVCHTHLSLLCCKIVCIILVLVLAILSVLHFVVAYYGEEALENMEYNDNIVGIWALIGMKSAMGLGYSSHKCHKRLLELEGSGPRPESPNFLPGGSVPYERIDPPCRGPNRSFHATLASRRQLSDDESVVTDGESVTTGSTSRALTVLSDGESAQDMDRVAKDLDANVSTFRDSRLVVT